MNILLTIHIMGAAWILGLLINAVYTLLKRHDSRYNTLARLIGWAGGIQLITGALLGLQAHGTILSFCSKIIAYITLITIAELALVGRLPAKQQQLRRRELLIPLSIGIAANILTIVIV